MRQLPGSFLLLPDSLTWCDTHGFVWQWRSELKRGGCPTCRREKQRERSQKTARIRKPPRPPFEKISKICSLCGEAVKGRRVSWCSQACVDLWWIATTPRIAFYHLAQEVGPVCWVCWDEGATEVDHVRALWTLNDQEREQLRWWLPFNLQLIGPRCHKDKTRREARLRADLRRAQKAAA